MTKMDIAKFFSSGQFDKCFDYLTDETVWNTPGEQYLRGRAEIEGFCKKIAAYFDSLTTDFRQLNVIADGNCIAINGTAEFIRAGKRVSFISSCDVYVFDALDRISSIHSYCITERPDK